MAKRNYKFTDKKHTRQGLASLGLGAAAIIQGGVMRQGLSGMLGRAGGAVTGAAGGVRYRPILVGEEACACMQTVAQMLSSPGRTFTRMQLLDDLWGWDTQSSESTVNVHVNRLRTRFAGWDDFKIETVRGIGYRGVVREEG